jgi:hypothetical protein
MMPHHMRWSNRTPACDGQQKADEGFTWMNFKVDMCKSEAALSGVARACVMWAMKYK